MFKVCSRGQTCWALFAGIGAVLSAASATRSVTGRSSGSAASGFQRTAVQVS